MRSVATDPNFVSRYPPIVINAKKLNLDTSDIKFLQSQKVSKELDLAQLKATMNTSKRLKNDLLVLEKLRERNYRQFFKKKDTEKVNLDLKRKAKEIRLSSLAFTILTSTNDNLYDTKPNLKFSGTETQVHEYIKYLSSYAPVSFWASADIKYISSKRVHVEGHLIFVSLPRYP